MYSIKLFEKLKNVTFSSCELDSNKIKTYLDQINQIDEIKLNIRQILDQTEHISTQDVCARIKNMTKEYLSNLDNPRPNYVYLPKKIGSEQYFFSQIYDLIPEIDLSNDLSIISSEKKLDKTKYPSEINLLIVDDASFSGNNTVGKIDDLSYDNKNIKINYIIIIPYQLKPIDKILSTIGLPPKQMERINIINVGGYATPPSIKLNNYTLGNEISNVSTCFFDHKVPNEFGSWPQIYLEGHLFNKTSATFGNLFLI